jgi:anti-sigma B factor antagonist
MEISCSTTANTGFISLIGQLWQKEDLSAVADAVETYIQDKILTIVLDIDRLSFINSAGLGLLARTHARVQEAGGKMIIFNPHTSVLEVIEISGFDLFMTIAKTENELKAALN